MSLLTALSTTDLVRLKEGRDEKTAQILILVIQELNEKSGRPTHTQEAGTFEKI